MKRKPQRAILRTVLITGATSGFGVAIARRFISEGDRVIITGRRGERLATVKKELGARCHAVISDVRSWRNTQALVSRLPDEFSEIDIVVANAGLALGLDPAQRAAIEDWDDMIATNINGLIYTVRAALPGMVKRDRGHVVLIGSTAGDYPYPGGNVYGATKAFVKQFALNLRADLLGSRVRVTSIEPGLAKTEFSLVRFSGDAKKAAAPYQGLTPLSADDVAEAVFWSCGVPAHVNVNRVQLMPVMQAFGPFAFSRSAE